MVRSIAVVVVALAGVAVQLAAQCAMCKSAVETSNNQAFTAALRDGIYLMLITPYLVAGAIALALVLRRRRRNRLPSPSLN